MSQYHQAGINTLFLWMTNRYFEGILQPDTYGDSLTLWDPYGYAIQKAREYGISPFIWYAPNNYKEPDRATELIEHPQWVPLFRDLVPQPGELDFAYDDMQHYEKNIILKMVERYHPDGVLLEEPYYQTIDMNHIGQQLSYSEVFRNTFKTVFGIDPLINPEDVNKMEVVREQTIYTFIRSLRQELKTSHPDMALATDGYESTARVGGTNPQKWVTDNLIDLYIPQAYRNTLEIDWWNAMFTDFSTAFGSGWKEKLVVGVVGLTPSSPSNNTNLMAQLDYIDKRDLGWIIFDSGGDSNDAARKEEIALLSSRYGTSPTPTLAPIPGDIWSPAGIPDGHVDMYDFNKMRISFGNPYTLFNYNELVGNFGK
jgi:hypothetical protein